jgi:hypothetical protein
LHEAKTVKTTLNRKRQPICDRVSSNSEWRARLACWSRRLAETIFQKSP